jgi:hypothetical protein
MYLWCFFHLCYATVDLARSFYIFHLGVGEKIDERTRIIFRIPEYPGTRVVFQKKNRLPGY